MLPWIRGWGGDVEVIAPPELREALLEELQRMNVLYGLEQESPSQSAHATEK